MAYLSELKNKNIGSSGKAPSGYQIAKLDDPNIKRIVTQKAIELLKYDYGYEIYQDIGGINFFFRIEPHPRYKDGTLLPDQWHKGTTVYAPLKQKAKQQTPPQQQNLNQQPNQQLTIDERLDGFNSLIQKLFN